MNRVTQTGGRDARGGYVIFAVLIVVVVLSLVAYRFTESMTAEYRASVRTNDDAQAKAAAISGLHYAAAVLADRETFYSELGANPFDNEAYFCGVEMPVLGTAGARKTALFDVRSVGLTDGGGYEQRYGVIDECSKLNINSMIQFDPTGERLFNALMMLPNMTPEVADAIVDWVDADDVKRPGGAETAEYQGLPIPYKAKNGPLNSLDELLLVQGVTPDLLYGGDTNRNGVQDEDELAYDRGWSDYLTVYGRKLNVDSTGLSRTYLNNKDLATLAQDLKTRLGEELAYYVLAAKLFSVTQTDANGDVPTAVSGTLTTGDGGTLAITFNTAQPAQTRPVRAASTDELRAAVDAKLEQVIATSANGGQRVRSPALLVYSRIKIKSGAQNRADDPDVVAFSPMIADPTLIPVLFDATTVEQAVEMVPGINVNTAPRAVLLAIPNMTEELADAIIAARPGQSPDDPGTTSCAWLITAAGVPPNTYRRMEKYITGTSTVYRIQSVGYFAEGGPVARMEAVVDTNQGAPRFLYVRDLTDLENPRGFDPAKNMNP